MAQIPLTKGKVAIVDDEDFKSLSQFNWYANSSRGKFWAARKVTIIYGDGKIKYKHLPMHRQIMNVGDPKVLIDHINGDGLDNRKRNLRLADTSKNARNRSSLQKTNTSGYRGVSFYKRSNSWQAYIRGNGGERKTLGYFSTPEEAARAFDKAAKEIYGKFCGKLNFED